MADLFLVHYLDFGDRAGNFGLTLAKFHSPNLMDDICRESPYKKGTGIRRSRN
jgi:hypothetical protein